MNIIEIMSVVRICQVVDTGENTRYFRLLRILNVFWLLPRSPTPSSPTQNSNCRCVGAEDSYKTLFQDSIVINL